MGDEVVSDVKLSNTTRKRSISDKQHPLNSTGGQNAVQDQPLPKPKGPPRPPIKRPYKVFRLRLEAEVPASSGSETSPGPSSSSSGSKRKNSKAQGEHSSGEATEAGDSLEFVNSNLLANSADRKRIRAHVAKQSHPSAAKGRNASISKPASSSGSRPGALRGVGKAVQREEAPKEDEPSQALTRPNSVARHLTILPGTYVSIIQQSQLAISRLILDDDSQKLGFTLNRMGCDLRLAIDHFIFMMYSQLSSFESRFAPSGVRDARMRLFIGFLLSDPALTLSILLAAIHHKLLLAGTAHTYPREMMVLRSFALSAINQAIEEPERATSDQLCFCVANMATYEAFMGTREAALVHLGGLEKMVNMRGGLDKLGLGGMLEKTIKWCDVGCSGVFGTPLVFAARDERGNSPPSDTTREEVVAFSAGLMK